MRILYLKLINYASIYAATKKKVLEINFSKAKHRVTLLIGGNGSGKSSVLDELHPFAFPGNHETREGKEMILENENGYKEIHFDKDGSVYRIRHDITGGKSYISRDGEELNGNGNKRSFIETVYNEMGLEPNHMSLIHLGSNISGFIDKKASERKKYASELMKELDVYAKLLRKVSEDSRIYRNLMKSVSDKIVKLNIRSEEEETQQLKELESAVVVLYTSRDEVNTKIGTLTGNLDALVPDGVESFRQTLRQKKSSLQQISQDLTNLKVRMNKVDIILMGSLVDQIEQTRQSIQSRESQRMVNEGMINFYFERLESLHTQLDDKRSTLKYIASDSEHNQINSLYLSLTDDRDNLKKIFKSFKPICTRSDLLEALAIMQDISKVITEIHEYDFDDVRTVVGYFMENKSVDGLVRSEVTKIDNKVNQLNIRIGRMDSEQTDMHKGYVLYKDPHADCTCPFQQFYFDTVGDKTTKNAADLHREISLLETKRERFMSYTTIVKKIEYMLMIMRSNKALLSRMPEDFFNINKILTSIKDMIPFYEEERLTEYVAVLEDYERYIQLDDKIKEVKRELQFIKSNSGSVLTAQTEITTLEAEIAKIDKDQFELRYENTKLDESVERFRDHLQKLELLQELGETDKRLTDEYLVLYQDIQGMQGTEEKINSHASVLEGLKSQLRDLDRSIHQHNEMIADLKYRLRDFKSLSEEKEILEEDFEETNIIRESLTSNKGMPLLYLRLFLRNIETKVNHFLDKIYHGSLEVCTFEISETEFNIPYIKNGIRVNDASRCSQGERTFIAMALSFALYERDLAAGGYNIFLWDEIDSTLDATNRAAFISLAEEELDSSNVEQVHIISHNNMFDSYPVDVILMDDTKIDNEKNVNIIYKP